MIKILEMLMGMFGGKKKGGLPDVGKVNDLKDQASELLEKHEETIDKVTDKIPGNTDDKLVDKAKDALK